MAPQPSQHVPSRLPVSTGVTISEKPQGRCFQGRGLVRACLTPERTRKHPAAGDRSVWDSEGTFFWAKMYLLNPTGKQTRKATLGNRTKNKVKRKHWLQNADAFTHAHGIQVIRPGYRGAGVRFTVVRGTDNLSHGVMPATISFLQYKFTSLSCG